MPLITLSTENKVKQNNDYPRLKLEHGERAAIIAYEQKPMVEYRHTLRAPEIDSNGDVVKEMRDGKPGKPAYEANSMEFIGQHLCFGDFNVLAKKGLDPEGCPTCAAAKEGLGVEAPKEHYAMHILRYALKPNSWELRDPFSVQVMAWVFAPTLFNKLIDLADGWDGDLRTHDMRLGPCENAMYQKYDINVVQKGEWTKTAERRQTVIDEYENNKTDDLSSLIGRKMDKSLVLEQIARVQERTEQARSGGKPAAKVATETSVAMNSDIAKLLGEDTPSDNVEDPFKEPESKPKAAAKKSAKAETADPDISSISFDELMKEL